MNSQTTKKKFHLHRDSDADTRDETLIEWCVIMTGIMVLVVSPTKQSEHITRSVAYVVQCTLKIKIMVLRGPARTVIPWAAHFGTFRGLSLI